MPRLLLVGLFLSGIAATLSGGTLTSGSFTLFPSAGMTATATVSGDNFTATVTDSDVGPFIFNGFPPFTLTPSGFAWDGEGGSFVDYNGFGYGGIDFSGCTICKLAVQCIPGWSRANDYWTWLLPDDILAGIGVFPARLIPSALS